MKCLKILIFAGVASLLLAVSGTASATVLCKNNSNTTTCSEPYAVGTKIEAKGVTNVVIDTEFTAVECKITSGTGEITNAGSNTSAVVITDIASVYEKCNCSVVVLEFGELTLTYIKGTDNATAIWNNEEITVNCSTVFGNVHCIYRTETTDTGKLVGGNPATVNTSGTVPRKPTSSLCSGEATVTDTSEISSPQPLYVSAG